MHHPAIDRHRHAIERDRAAAQRDVEVAGRVAVAAGLGVRAGGEQEIALVTAAVHAERRLAVVKAERGPAGPMLEPPADMGHVIGVGIAEGLHEAADVFRGHAALDPRHDALLDGEHGAVGGIALERQQDVARVDHDLALGRALVGPARDHAARPMVPAAGLVGQAELFQHRILAEAAAEIGAGLRGHGHLARLAHEDAGALDLGLRLGRRDHPQHGLGRLDGEQHPGAGLQDLFLLGREQHLHRVDHQIGGLQRGERRGVEGEGGLADIARLVARQRLFAVDRRQVDHRQHAAEQADGDARAIHYLHVAVVRGQDCHLFPGLQLALFQHVLPGNDEIGVADHGVLLSVSGGRRGGGNRG
ncbi:hypothetical protein SDC9_38211 [bioreactor metagenome]|uniref:Uncharacterized protein n=1 Tax=bioreactor metagenome TaxID=1076179 RepID=A0A644VL25_9ZZZZ